LNYFVLKLFTLFLSSNLSPNDKKVVPKIHIMMNNIENSKIKEMIIFFLLFVFYSWWWSSRDFKLHCSSQLGLILKGFHLIILLQNFSTLLFNLVTLLLNLGSLFLN
jgi:hypothetical protein